MLEPRISPSGEGGEALPHRPSSDQQPQTTTEVHHPHPGDQLPGPTAKLPVIEMLQDGPTAEGAHQSGKHRRWIGSRGHTALTEGPLEHGKEVEQLQKVSQALGQGLGCDDLKSVQRGMHVENIQQGPGNPTDKLSTGHQETTNQGLRGTGDVQA